MQIPGRGNNLLRPWNGKKKKKIDLEMRRVMGALKGIDIFT